MFFLQYNDIQHTQPDICPISLYNKRICLNFKIKCNNKRQQRVHDFNLQSPSYSGNTPQSLIMLWVLAGCGTFLSHRWPSSGLVTSSRLDKSPTTDYYRPIRRRPFTAGPLSALPRTGDHSPIKYGYLRYMNCPDWVE